MIVNTPFGMIQRRLIDAGVADKTVDGLRHAKLIHVAAEVSNRLEGIQLALHGSKVFQIKSIDFSHGLHLI